MIGTATSDPARAAGGACLTITALTLLALRLIRTWVTDASDERSRAQQAVQRADEDRVRYVAAQAALEVERDRLRRDTEDIVQKAEEERIALHAKLHQEFEERRGQLIAETFEAAFRILKAGDLPVQGAQGKEVIPFPSLDRLGSRPTTPGRDISRL
ncbi:hypothetical protein [Streptomyces mobaraensis]|uniref:Uncharacterized protein n=1 Tax=Streptomyces mobaraensis TaxID=35621 RepID=A0A5N5WE40_STRMB|nr:hypothetical protein [Streptomyces mobaraensis]KAB7850200.1 hypothetical protein FRZ00_06270 [Streptomyces mobaraensis]